MFSLKSLLISVFVAAVYIAGFLYASAIWASVIVTVTLGLLAGALVAIYLVPERRSFLVPAVLVGVLYGLAAFVQPLGLHDSLITTRMFFELWYADKGEAADSLLNNFATAGTEFDKANVYTLISSEVLMMGGFIPAEVMGNFWPLQRIGHCSVAIVVAVVAGLVGSYVGRRTARTVSPNRWTRTLRSTAG